MHTDVHLVFESYLPSAKADNICSVENVGHYDAQFPIALTDKEEKLKAKYSTVRSSNIVFLLYHNGFVGLLFRCNIEQPKSFSILFNNQLQERERQNRLVTSEKFSEGIEKVQKNFRNVLAFPERLCTVLSRIFGLGEESNGKNGVGVLGLNETDRGKLGQFVRFTKFKSLRL